MVQGGVAEEGSTNETWLYERGDNDRPAIQLDVYPDFPSVEDTPTVEGLFVRARCAAGGTQGTVGNPGPDMRAWRLRGGSQEGGRWTRPRRGQTIEEPHWLQWRSDTPQDYVSLRSDGSRLVPRRASVQCRPRKRSGTGVATVSMDFAEVWIDYRLPAPAAP